MNWTSPSDLLAQVQKLWDSGDLLEGAVAFPLRLRFKRPTSRELADEDAAIRKWLAELDEGSAKRGYGIEREAVTTRLAGTNLLPVRVVVPSREVALRMLGKASAASRFAELRATLLQEFPALAPWVQRRPHQVLAFGAEWDRILSVLRWFRANPRSRLYRRQLEIEGVDTKFIESHRPVLTELLELVLPTAELAGEPGDPFDRRFGLLEKPALVRFRLLDESLFLHGLADVTIPVRDLAKLDLRVDDVIVTENEVNGLALPERRGTMVIFGGGYALERLKEVTWLSRRRVRYWGDIDTHGFAMLDRFRAHFPEVESLMMDRSTFVEHQAMWVVEERQSTHLVTRLTDAERELHQDLVTGTYGDRLRLEQERLNFGWVRQAMGS